MSAADQLEGLELENGWRVAAILAPSLASTGGNFSRSYIVEKRVKDANGKEAVRTGFLKAFDFRKAFEPGEDTVRRLQYLTSAYEHEREVLQHCRGRRLSNVVAAIDHGSIQVPELGVMEGRVYYLIFELAAGDVRVQMDVTTARDALWCMQALRDVCLGLWQVHKETIAHQDAKPSNVLSYEDQIFKIADFGRSARKGHASPHDQLHVPGDPCYSPPELMYGHIHPDFGPRRFGCDLYMLGNLAAFLFSGCNVTASLFMTLDPQHHPLAWGGGYEAVLPYLRSAFTRMLADFALRVDPMVRDDLIAIVTELCDPDLAKRGHPKRIGRHDQYSLERYVTRLDLIAKRLAVRMRVEAAA